MSVLSVSNDPALLFTRHRMLEAAGYCVTSALGLTEAEAECKRGGFNLLVLGHSIAIADKKTLISHFRATCTGPIVSLLRFGEAIVDDADYHVSPDDPAELVRQIFAIVLGRLLEPNPYLLFGRSRWVPDLLASAIEATAADFGNVQLFDSENRVLRIVAQHGFDNEFLRYFDTVRDNDCACGAAMNRRSRIVVTNVASDPIFRHNGSRDVMLRAKVRSVQSTPLTGQSGNFIGIASTHYDRLRSPSPRMWECLDEVIATFMPKIKTDTGHELLGMTGCESPPRKQSPREPS